MPDLLEHIYCAQQINIPPNLPYILKQYAKAAIRTQPYDLLYWSAEYFKAKANNMPVPVKDRLEYPPFDSPSRLSPGFLKVLHKQLGRNETIAAQDLYDRWIGVCLVKEALDSMLDIGSLRVTNKIVWLKFVAVAAGHLCSSLKKTMILICEVLTNEPEGGSAMIPIEVFVNLYQFLARLDCGPETCEDLISSEHIENSTTSETTNDSVCSEIKVKKVEDEKDSTTGLMVWDDIKPEEKSDRVSSPKYTEEPGASSELGIEVLDDAIGPVEEEITIIPAEPVAYGVSNSQRHTSTTSPAIPTHLETDSTLSHSSLKDNVDWLKIKSKTLQEPSRSSKELNQSSSSSDQGLRATESSAEGNTSKIIEKPTPESEERDGVIENNEKKGEISDVHEIENQASQDSEFGISENVTKRFTIEDINRSTMTYSSLEIRKGYVGDEPEDEIERTSSENTIKNVETVIQMKPLDSSECWSQENFAGKSNLFKSERSSSDVSKTIKKDIAGIGPIIPEPQILAVVEYMQYWAAKQQGCVMPRNINHLLCPPLDLPLSEPTVIIE